MLRNYARRIEQGDLGSHHLEFFIKAAEAAETGEPMIVIARDRIEMALLAAGYAQFGCEPIIDELFQGAAA